MVNAENITHELAEALAFSQEEKNALAKARNKPITFDEDCPETTCVQARQFRRVNPHLDKIGKQAQ